MKSIIRVRRDEDMDGCVSLLARVHEQDGYPSRWPEDPRSWLRTDNLLVGWTAHYGEEVVGHVALCRVDDGPESSIWSTASKSGPRSLAAVSRLFVAPEMRGRGLGMELLTTACSEATSRGLIPVLDVLDKNRAAIALYERAGWRRAGTAPASWTAANGDPVQVHYYLSPQFWSKDDGAGVEDV